jgi:hypothetical protein
MAVATELMVDPDHRGFAAFELLRRHFAGPQDLTFSDVANSKARVIWEGLRGESGLLYSLEWSRPLRPWRHAANQLTTGTAGRVARGAFRPFFRLADNRLVRREHATFKIQRPSETRVRPLDPAAMEHELARLCAKRSLRPHYPAHLSSWLMQQLRKKGLGSLRCMVTEDLDGRCLGWFIYFSNPGGTGQVVQVISSTAHISLLLDAMFFDAWEEGVVELSGRADPASLAEYSAKGCRFYTTPTSVLVHSRNPEVLKSIRLGQALLTRLEGEWWMNP